MSELFDDLKQGLEEALAYECGEGRARVRTYMIEPIREYSGSEIRAIRMRAGMTQRVFAYYMGVSQKTVEAWECGRTHPTGTVFRMLSLLEHERIDETEYIISTVEHEGCEITG